MINTTTRRGLRPLLALLLTGMALLMMGAARPVQAATPSAGISVDTLGYVTGPDSVSWNAGLSYTGPSGSVDMDYYVDCKITFYSGAGVLSTATIHNVDPTDGGGGSPISAHSTFTCAAGQYGLSVMNSNPNISGFKWNYTITVEGVNDENSNVGTATATSATQSYGAFGTTSPVTPPPGGGPID